METTKHVNFDKYAEFVDAVTSDASKDFLSLSDRLVALDEKGANIERLLTGAVGAAAESGELLEVVKKLVFQGKSWNEETKFHIQRELGDLMWYVAQICIALFLLELLEKIRHYPYFFFRRLFLTLKELS